LKKNEKTSHREKTEEEEADEILGYGFWNDDEISGVASNSAQPVYGGGGDYDSDRDDLGIVKPSRKKKAAKRVDSPSMNINPDSIEFEISKPSKILYNEVRVVPQTSSIDNSIFQNVNTPKRKKEKPVRLAVPKYIKPQKIYKHVNPQTTSSSTRSGGGIGRFHQLIQWKKERSAQFASIVSRHAIVNKSAEMMTPFGFSAISVSDSKLKKSVNWVFRGPKNSNGNCWLNAMLGLGLTFGWKFFLKTKSLGQLEYLDPQENFFMEIYQLYEHWVIQPHNSDNFKEKSILLHKKVWMSFQKRGFTSGEPYCVIRAFLILLKQIEPFLRSQAWTIIEVDLSDKENTRKEIEKCKTDFIVIVNPSYSSLQSQTFKDLEYSFHSLISYEQLFSDTKTDKDISHYKCVTIDNEKKGVFLYDDLMSLKPGGYQGTYLFNGDERTKKIYQTCSYLYFEKNCIINCIITLNFILFSFIFNLLLSVTNDTSRSFLASILL